MSQTRRFFACSQERQDDKVRLVSQYHHLTKVLRAKVGDQVTLCFDDGKDTLCVIEKIDKQAVYLTIVEQNNNTRECPVDITLFFGCLKGTNTPFVVQKAVELGAAKIVPFTSSNTISNCDSDKIDRLNKISLEASKQCGRAVLVQVEKTVDFSCLVKSLDEFPLVVFCCERGGQPLYAALNDNAKINKVAVVIGSEGGFTSGEIDTLCALSNVRAVSLGGRILRAETASIYALSVLTSFFESTQEV